MRGGDDESAGIEYLREGRSPRARRRRDLAALNRDLHGSISACAEEAKCAGRLPCTAWVDLRVRGGDAGTVTDGSSITGRSPRARRRQPRLASQILKPGSISACAEETKGTQRGNSPCQVDLRVRGGDDRSNHGWTIMEGRSPRARRRPGGRSGERYYPGSISACAEETSLQRPSGLL